jgi:hypothetical protein
MKDTFTLWGVKDCGSGKIMLVETTRLAARNECDKSCERVVKLECRIVQPQRKPKRGKYPNDNFGLPAGYKPHNPDKLTREQVGEGFRPLADVEIWHRLDAFYNISAWAGTRWGGNDYGGSWPSLTYRIPINAPLDINPELETK